MSSVPGLELPIVRVQHETARSPGPAKGHERDRLARRARLLSLVSIAWMTVEAGAAIASAVIAGSVALLGFGLDSLIELASAGTILWLYTGNRHSSGSAERRAQRVIAICFLALALYIASDAIDTLVVDTHPETSWPGLAVAAGAIVLMPLLARAKNQVAAQLASTATASDAAQSWLCAISAAAVLFSILANALLGWWWLDPATGLGIAALAVHEGRQAWTGHVCADCTPIGFAPHTVSNSDDRACCS
jgi:divalent metal cation (Fe/Co/Zn/Cd) transporter